jgi:hypothetical protein
MVNFTFMPTAALIIVLIPATTGGTIATYQRDRSSLPNVTVYREEATHNSSSMFVYNFDLWKLIFEIEARRLLDETLYVSSISAIIQHPAFARIAGMGPPAVGLILERMRTGEVRTPWFPLLKHISNEDPVPVTDRGRVQKMAKSWIRWGIKNGYLA